MAIIRQGHERGIFLSTFCPSPCHTMCSWMDSLVPEELPA